MHMHTCEMGIYKCICANNKTVLMGGQQPFLFILIETDITPATDYLDFSMKPEWVYIMIYLSNVSCRKFNVEINLNRKY